MKNPVFEANPSLDCYFETADGSCFFTENAADSHARSLTEKTVKTRHKSDYVEPTQEVAEPSESVAPEMKIVRDDEQNASNPVEPVITTKPVLTTEKVETEATAPVAQAVKTNIKK